MIKCACKQIYRGNMPVTELYAFNLICENLLAALYGVALTEQSARPPNLGAAMDVVRRRLGDSKADSLAMRSDVYSPCQPETFSNDSGSHNYPKNLIGGKL